MKRLILVLIMLNLKTLRADNIPYQMVSYIQSTDSISCNWVSQVGSTQPSNVTFLEIGASLCETKGNDGSSTSQTGVCSGVIRCSGIEGWGDVYFENVICPGRISFGDLKCGRSGELNKSDRNVRVEGVKSCLADFISNEGQIVQGTNNVIKQTPRNQEAVQ